MGLIIIYEIMKDIVNSVQRGDNKLFVAIVLSQIVTMYPLLGIRAMQIVSLANYILMAIATYLLISSVIKNHLKIEFSQKLFFIWIVYIYIAAIPIIIGGYMNYLYLKKFLTYYMFMYSIPFFMICSLNEAFIKQLFKLIYLLCCLYFISLIAGKGLNEGFTMLAEGVIILLMTLSYHKSKKKIVIILCCLLCIVLMMLAARRNKVVYFGGGLIMAFLINAIYSKKSGSKIGWLFLIFVLLIGFVFTASYFSYFFERVGTGMSSRQVVLDYYFEDFNSTPTDWITGRGMYGEFFGGLANASDENTEMRDGIENGYLFLILKGGLIWVCLLIIISLRAIYKGLFKSNNLLCKGFAMIILLYLIDMVGFGIPTTWIKYIMVYISIAGCNTEWLRNCSDDYLANRIGLK